MKKQIVLACLLGASTLPAVADNFYVLGDVGQGKMEVDVGDNYTFNKTSTTYSLGVGYNFNQFVAVEVAYRDLGSVTDRGSYTEGGVQYTYRDKTSATAFQASVVGSLPLSDEFSLYGRVGVGKIEADYSSSDIDFSGSESKTKGLVGIGASYKLSPEVALRAEYNQFAKWDETKLSAFTVGATYSF